MKLPVLFIFDLDLTLIGSTENLWKYDDFINFVKDTCALKNLDGEACKRSVSWKEAVTDDFFRPGLKESLHKIKKIYPTAEFFVYSSGEDKYVKDYIQLVERFTGVHFCRPIIGRSKCLTDEKRSYVKHVDGQLIINSLKARYPIIETHIDNVLNGRTIIIDDNQVWPNDDRLIQCSAYNYTQCFDIDEKLLMSLHYNDDMAKALRSYQKSSRFDLFPLATSPGITYDEFKLNYHLGIANLYRKYMFENSEALKDIFMETLVKAIQPYCKHIKPFSKAHIDIISKRITQQKKV